MIKYKSYSVYPREIEEVLYIHDCVTDAAVIGVPHPHVGERIKAFDSIKFQLLELLLQELLLLWVLFICWFFIKKHFLEQSQIQLMKN